MSPPAFTNRFSVFVLCRLITIAYNLLFKLSHTCRWLRDFNVNYTTRKKRKVYINKRILLVLTTALIHSRRTAGKLHAYKKKRKYITFSLRRRIHHYNDANVIIFVVLLKKRTKYFCGTLWVSL